MLSKASSTAGRCSVSSCTVSSTCTRAWQKHLLSHPSHSPASLWHKGGCLSHDPCCEWGHCDHNSPAQPGLLLRLLMLFQICSLIWFCAQAKHCRWLAPLQGCGQQNSRGSSQQHRPTCKVSPFTLGIHPRCSLQEARWREAEDGFGITGGSARMGQLCKATAGGAQASNTSYRQMMC